MKIPKILFITVIVIILVAGLWPFQFRPPNQVHHDDVAGLVFGKRAIAYARDLNWQSSENAGFTFETWLQAEGPITNHFGNVACITQNSSCANFLLGQWKSTPLLTATFRDAKGSTRARKLGVLDALSSGQRANIVISSGEGGTRFYVDGALREKSSARLAIENGYGMLVLGNSAVGAEPWGGAIAGVAIYGRALDAAEVRQRFQQWKQTGKVPVPVDSAAWFDFTGSQPASLSFDGPRPGAVYAPKSFVPPRRSILAWDIRFDRGGMSDILLNFFGFIPFGFLACLIVRNRARMRNALLWSTVTGIALSAAIELTQAYMPGRDSSAVDLLFNSAGTLAGALLCAWCVFSGFPHVLQNRGLDEPSN